MQPRVLVTGGSGFIGTNLVAHYLAKGATVLNLDLRSPRDPAHQAIRREVDLLDAAALKREISAFGPTHLFHFAARTDLEGKTLDEYAANTTGLGNLIDAIVEAPHLQRTVFASSRLVCRIGYQPHSDEDYCPTTAYGESKVAGERLLRSRGPEMRCDWLVVRPTSIWGPYFDVPYRNFFDAVRAGRYLHPRGRLIRKSFGYVGNSVHQLDRLMFAAPREAVQARMFYLCDDPPIEVREWAEQIREAFDAPAVREVPLRLLRAAALAGDALQKLGVRNPPLTSFRLDNLLTEMLHDTAGLEEICGPLPFSVAEGVRATVDWMRSRAP